MYTRVKMKKYIRHRHIKSNKNRKSNQSNAKYAICTFSNHKIFGNKSGDILCYINGYRIQKEKEQEQMCYLLRLVGYALIMTE